MPSEIFLSLRDLCYTQYISESTCSSFYVLTTMYILLKWLHLQSRVWPSTKSVLNNIFTHFLGNFIRCLINTSPQKFKFFFSILNFHWFYIFWLSEILFAQFIKPGNACNLESFLRLLNWVNYRILLMFSQTLTNSSLLTYFYYTGTVLISHSFSLYYCNNLLSKLPVSIISLLNLLSHMCQCVLSSIRTWKYHLLYSKPSKDFLSPTVVFKFCFNSCRF